MLPNRLAVDIPTEIIARVNDIDACAEGLPVGRDTIATLTHSSFDDQGTLYVGWTRGNFRYHGSVHVDCALVCHDGFFLVEQTQRG